MTPRALLVAALLAVPGFVSAQDRSENADEPIQIEVMTFNIRTSEIRDGDDSWPMRKELLVETVRRRAPDVLGLQEAMGEQIEYLASAFPEYRWLGVDRGLNGGTGLSEATPLFYRHAELVPIESGTFWLGNAPSGPFRGRDGGRGGSRIVTWARFHHLETARQIYVFNTHFSPRTGQQHLDAFARIEERLGTLPPGSAVILMGDFNSTAGDSDTWRVAMEHGLRDAWEFASARVGPASTFNGFRPAGSEEEGEGRIDWILLGGPIDVDAAETVIDSAAGHYPSDHFPVLAKLTIRAH